MNCNYRSKLTRLFYAYFDVAVSVEFLQSGKHIHLRMKMILPCRYPLPGFVVKRCEEEIEASQVSVYGGDDGDDDAMMMMKNCSYRLLVICLVRTDKSSHLWTSCGRLSCSCCPAFDGC